MTIVIQEPVTQVVEVADESVLLVEQTITETVELGVVGPQGPKGDKGDSADESFRYTHNQLLAASTWNITHNLDGFPNVSVVDSGGTSVEGEVIYVDNNNVTLNFSAPFGGKAYLS